MEALIVSQDPGSCLVVGRVWTLVYGSTTAGVAESATWSAAGCWSGPRTWSTEPRIAHVLERREAGEGAEDACW